MPNERVKVSRYERDLSTGLVGKYAAVAQLLTRPARILELGAASGYFAAALCRRGHDVTAVEGDPESAALCRARGISTHCEDLASDTPLTALEPESFEVVLAMDVLEHLPAPSKLLDALHRVMTKGSRLIVTGPNVAYWHVRLELLRGRWSYEPAGIMDETHLRWYTRSTWSALLASSGFRIRQSLPLDVMLPKEHLLKRFGMKDQPLGVLHQLAGRVAPELFATMFLVEATRDE